MSIPSLTQADSGHWYARWTDGRRSKRKSMGTRDAAVAQTRFAQWLLLGGADVQAEVTYKVADLWAVYDAKHVQPNVANPDTHRWSWANLSAHFADLTLAEVTEAVPSYVAARTAGRIGRPAKSATVRKELALLRACFNWCADAKFRKPLIKLADVPGFGLPEDSEPRDRWLREEEVARLLAAAERLRVGNRLSRVERFLWLALETAGRKGALLDLTWDRVDMETNVIHLRDPEKRATKKRRASVPISRALRPVLERAYAEREGDLVLDHGGDVWAALQAVAVAAGFAASRERAPNGKPRATGISPHVMRHTAATRMARRGVPLYIVAKVLGNTIQVVERTYAKHCPDDLRAAVDTISGK